MKRWIVILSGTCCLLAGTVGLAQAPSRPQLYFTAGAGAGHAANGSFDGNGTEVDFDLGRPIGMLGVGVDSGRGWRVELDASYRYNDAEVVFFGDGSPDVAPDGDSRITAPGLSVSALYDLDVGRAFKPYVGVGAGVARVDYRLREYITEVELLDDSDTVFTYQLIAGFGLPLSPHLDLTADYRYWQAPDIQLTADDGSSLDTEHEVHSILVSLRYRPGERPGALAGGGAGRLPDSGWYAQVLGGPSFAADAEIKNNIANFDAFDVGSAGLLAAGYAFRGPWRAELEASRRRNEAELVDFNPEFGEDRASGRVSASSVMVNVAYEPAWTTRFQPYALVGVGVAWSHWDVRLDTDGSTYVDDRGSTAAGQVAFGATARLTDRLSVAAEYRYWMTGRFDLHQPDGRPMRVDHTVHSAMLGLRYALSN